jgi:hypothetical protein
MVATAPHLEINHDVVYASQEPLDTDMTMSYIPFSSKDGRKDLGFYIDDREVSNGEYFSFLQATGRKPPLHWHHNVPPKGMEKAPIVNISYQDAVAYATWVGKRLPKGPEWRKAIDLLSPSHVSYLYIAREEQEASRYTEFVSWSSPKVHTKKVEPKNRSPFATVSGYNSVTGLRCVKNATTIFFA